MGRSLRFQHERRRSRDHENIYFKVHHFLRQGAVAISLAFSGLPVDRDVLAVNPAKFAHALQEVPRGGFLRIRAGDVRCCDSGMENHDPGYFSSLRLGGERRGDETEGKSAHERPPVHYWITSSARSSSGGGMVRPSALAVLRLMMNSNLLGCSTGRSAGFTPLRILPTNVAARRRNSIVSALYVRRPPASTYSRVQ